MMMHFIKFLLYTKYLYDGNTVLIDILQNFVILLIQGTPGAMLFALYNVTHFSFIKSSSIFVGACE